MLRNRKPRTSHVCPDVSEETVLRPVASQLLVVRMLSLEPWTGIKASPSLVLDHTGYENIRTLSPG